MVLENQNGVTLTPHVYSASSAAAPEAEAGKSSLALRVRLVLAFSRRALAWACVNATNHFIHTHLHERANPSINAIPRLLPHASTTGPDEITRMRWRRHRSAARAIPVDLTASSFRSAGGKNRELVDRRANDHQTV
jgi:hypothetical protein